MIDKAENATKNNLFLFLSFFRFVQSCCKDPTYMIVFLSKNTNLFRDMTFGKKFKNHTSCKIKKFNVLAFSPYEFLQN